MASTSVGTDRQQLRAVKAAHAFPVRWRLHRESSMELKLNLNIQSNDAHYKQHSDDDASCYQPRLMIQAVKATANAFTVATGSNFLSEYTEQRRHTTLCVQAV